MPGDIAALVACSSQVSVLGAFGRRLSDEEAHVFRRRVAFSPLTHHSPFPGARSLTVPRRNPRFCFTYFWPLASGAIVVYRGTGGFVSRNDLTG